MCTSRILLTNSAASGNESLGFNPAGRFLSVHYKLWVQGVAGGRFGHIRLGTELRSAELQCSSRKLWGSMGVCGLTQYVLQDELQLIVCTLFCQLSWPHRYCVCSHKLTQCSSMFWHAAQAVK